eukprot:Gregarina_sp_Poly_1__10205@NODE_706_length_6680_cov_40_845456_g533_i0_p2_GENE_NODE_706_length_6680_cov_40_845456_g533_i0NODE_706_length_6680_cov_40_845456_g533_i0_p2_ORF_typecomplete_len722_score96_58Kelch_4/PF13418_6/15Kelch_4/PF13418_6/0_0053Kelch_4/PF13418_6/1e06Kelch_4/PF13418_6/0_055Kelch_4/PF13418_6/3_2Kelch_4/PF13418_6/0_25Kelch_5/PF13854_6/30Kelch_5/PF13854_6/0_11Kelch_5/PF13854_6/1_5e05Kelch_5/PF13854_6/0_0068Kelch_5/PF13854_6/2_7e02Kelch_5/PF13854_6/0_31Kelch_6/PF13964_6/3_8e02Kelch_6/
MARKAKQPLGASLSLVSSSSHRLDSVRNKSPPRPAVYNNNARTNARDGSWNRTGAVGGAVSNRHFAVPTLLDSDDSAQIARPFAAPMDEPLSPFPGQSRIHSREGGAAGKAAIDMLREPERRTRGLLEAEGLDGRGATIAEARAEAAARKKRFSPGDRVAYIADRVDFQAARQGTAYYALAVVGDERQILIHGGQFGSIPMLDVETATNEAFRWRWGSRSPSADTGGDEIGDSSSFSLIEENIETLPLVGHSMICYKGTRVFIYGGCGPQVSGLFSHVYAANLKNGTSAPLQTSCPQPPGRARHACALWNNLMIIHGGHCHRSGSRLLSDMWSLDLRDTTWERWPVDAVNTASTETDLCSRKDGPGGRYGHHMAVWRDWLFLAFGSDGGRGLNDIWAYHLHDRYWSFIVPRGKISDSRVDCAAAKFGEDRWLFHGGLDSTTGTMLNSFYEFNFKTHEGRILRVELAVAPLKILPALMGHGMVCINTEELGTKLVIFGGINRQSTIVHVVYAMGDTGKSPGVFTDEVPMPERKTLAALSPPLTTPRAVTTVQATPLTATTSPTGDTPLLTTCNPDAMESHFELTAAAHPFPDLPDTEDVEQKRRMIELEEENRKLQIRVAELESTLALYPSLTELADLSKRSDKAIDHLLELRSMWSSVFEAAVQAGRNSQKC